MQYPGFFPSWKPPGQFKSAAAVDGRVADSSTFKALVTPRRATMTVAYFICCCFYLFLLNLELAGLKANQFIQVFVPGILNVSIFRHITLSKFLYQEF
jgi:hypothetical protein